MGYKLTVLVGRERNTGMTLAKVVPAKGSKGKFTGDKVMEYLGGSGNQFGDIIVKTDQEPAIKCLVEDTSWRGARRWGTRPKWRRVRLGIRAVMVWQKEQCKRSRAS